MLRFVLEIDHEPSQNLHELTEALHRAAFAIKREPWLRSDLAHDLNYHAIGEWSIEHE